MLDAEVIEFIMLHPFYKMTLKFALKYGAKLTHIPSKRISMNLGVLLLEPCSTPLIVNSVLTIGGLGIMANLKANLCSGGNVHQFRLTKNYNWQLESW